MIQTNNRLNVHLATVFDADLKIANLKNVRSHLKINRNNKSMSVSVKGVIVNFRKNTTTVVSIMRNIYMYLWYVCLIMTKSQVEILVTVQNGPIGFYSQEQHAT